MPSLSETIRRFHQIGSGLHFTGDVDPLAGLVDLEWFGQNPGNLHALLHLPADLPPGAPLVVALHGCTQTAAVYARGSGWSELADRFGFAVLYPEQRRANNPNLCFNWFLDADTRRGSGETESISEMVIATVARHSIDPVRVFITGLSAGGAMTAAMLATRPELFAGGAVVAGLPYGSAAGVPEALERMRGRGHDLAHTRARVREASAHRGPWPAVSVWHGTADATVTAVNADLVVEQWRGVHGVGEPETVDRRAGHAHKVWRDAAGRIVIEEHLVAGVGHGVPIAVAGDEACGKAGPHFIDAGVSSTYRIAASWGIVPSTAPAVPARRDGERGSSGRRPNAAPAPATGLSGPARAIDDALRAAGLMGR